MRWSTSAVSKNGLQTPTMSSISTRYEQEMKVTLEVVKCLKWLTLTLVAWLGETPVVEKRHQWNYKYINTIHTLYIQVHIHTRTQMYAHTYQSISWQKEQWAGCLKNFFMNRCPFFSTTECCLRWTAPLLPRRAVAFLGSDSSFSGLCVSWSSSSRERKRVSVSE